MKILDLFKRYVARGTGITFDVLYELGEVKGYYSTKEDLEIELERAMDEGLIVCIRYEAQNENRFFLM